MPETPERDTAKARRALADAQRSERRADALVAESGRILTVLRATREANHFADKFRGIITGGNAA